MHPLFRIVSIAALANMLPVSALAQGSAPARPVAPPAPAAKAEPANPDTRKPVVTEHELVIGGKPLKYRATAGRMAVNDESGKPKADFFFVAYERLPAETDPAKRPVTFVFNGGPGAASVWLHLGAVGPQRLAIDPQTDLPTSPVRLEDNPDSWLTATDLVFIDPVGTGYSRAAAGENPGQFFGVREDIRWVAEFIRLYTTRNQRWLSPKYLAGESYGTTRAAGLSQYLQQADGIDLDGIILISSVLNFATVEPGPGNDLPYAVYLPSYTAVAWHHHKLAPDLQADLPKAIAKARQWATDTYGPALARGAALSADARAAVCKDLARFTGLAPEFVDKANLRIDPPRFEGSLLAAERKVVGRFDGRITGFNPDPLEPAAGSDPSFQPYLSAYTAAVNDYVRRGLKYENDLAYETLSRKTGPWNMGEGGHGYLDVSENLADAMTCNPHLRVMFASGYQDLATPFDASTHTIDHMRLSPEARARISHRFYEGGHMFYHHRPSLAPFGADVRAFIEAP